MTTQQTDTAANDTTTADTGTTAASADTATGGGAAGSATDSTGTDAAGDEWKDFDAERAKQTILNQRRVEADLKRQLAENADIVAKAAETERAKLSEQERLAADLEAAKKDAEAAKREALDARFESAAIAAGIPADRLKAARAVAGEVATTDESGIVSIDTTVFDRLRETDEYLFGQQAAPQTSVSFGAAASQGQGGQQSGLSADEVAMAQRAGMSTEEWAKYAQRTRR